MTNPHFMDEFYLDPGVVHLNHGSYGAVPRSVMQAQNAIREQIERRCSSFFREGYFEQLETARTAAAGFLGGCAQDWVFVENATSACNAVILSQNLQPGDEILFTSEIYGAVRKALRHWANPGGVTLVEVPLELPCRDPDDVVAAVQARLTPRTRLAIFDHITSPSALVLPVDQLIAACRANGTRVLIDGAHAPGHIPVDVPSVGADYYTGNAHKWLFAPKGCALLWTDPACQDDLHPMVISHGYEQGYRAEFDWIGTRDPSAWLCLPAAHDAWTRFGGWDQTARNIARARAAGEALAAELGSEIAAPPSMRCAMATVRLPGCTGDPGQHFSDVARRYGVEPAFMPFGAGLGVRLSAQVYTRDSDFERLTAALKDHFGL